MKTIYKYPLKMTLDKQIIEIPMTGQIVDFAFQDDDPFIWMLFDKLFEGHNQKVIINIRGTGHDVSPETQIYFKSAHVAGFVWHLFYGYDTSGFDPVHFVKQNPNIAIPLTH